MIGASCGKSNTRAILVHARKPEPTSASVLCVSTRTIELLPLCTLPISHTTGANWRARSAMGDAVSGGWLIYGAYIGCRGLLPACRSLRLRTHEWADAFHGRRPVRWITQGK